MTVSATASLPRLQPNSGLTEFGRLLTRPKSDTSDFGWRDREGARWRNFTYPLPTPPPQAEEGADRACGPRGDLKRSRLQVLGLARARPDLQLFAGTLRF